MGDDHHETYGFKMSQPLNIAFIGNPNSGKTSLFNALSGLNQKVGNFPGVTVEAKIVNLQGEFGKQIKLIDLPGAYSLFPVSEDEKILNQCLSQTDHPYYPDIALYVADVRLLDKQLLLLTQINDLGIPMLICLTNIDHVDPETVGYWKNLLAEKFNTIVFPVSNRTGENQAEIKKWILQADVLKIENKSAALIDYNYERLQSIGLNSLPNPNENARNVFKSTQQIKSNTAQYSDFIRFQIQDTMERYQHIDGWITESIGTNDHQNKKYKSLFTAKVDRILTHPVLGLAIFMGILFVIFQMIFSLHNGPWML
ncbi:MAG: ferrous iron transporter B [Saprospiraceae bacterium]|nr:ferrous iron transporter B [Saprospiraceae bacterium]